MALSSKQYEVLDFIKKFIATNGYSPTIREIAAGLYLKSPSSVQEHLRKLANEGIITTGKYKSRTIELLVQNEYLNTFETIAKIPVLEKSDNTIIKTFLEVPIYMLNEYDPKNLYAFKDKKSIYIVNVSLKRKNKPSLTIKDDELSIEQEPTNKIFGNIISEYKIY